MLQVDLAKKSGLSQSTISRIVTGERNPSAELCILIAEALDLPPQLLFFEAGLMPRDKHANKFTSEIEFKFSKLKPQEQDFVLHIIDYFLNDNDREDEIERKNGYLQEKLDISPQ
jgi:transcriptional regulator with XRE-family HTH domain